MQKSIIISLAICFIISLSFFRGRELSDRLWTNCGFISLSSELVTSGEKHLLISKNLFSLAIDFDLPHIHDNALRGLGYVYALKLDHPSALDTFSSIPSYSPAYYLVIGDWFWEKNHWVESIFWYKTAVQHEPNLITAWLKLGDAHSRIAETENALIAYESGWLRNQEVSSEKYISLLIQQNQLASAEDKLRQTLESAKNSRVRLWLWHTLGQILRKQQRWDEAIATYQEAIKEFPDTPSFLASIGWAHYDSGNGYGIAYQYFEAAVNLEDNNPDSNDSGSAYFAMGEFLAKEGKYYEADQWFQKALNINPDNRRWYIVRANTAVLNHNHTLAINTLNAAAERYPTFSQAYYELATVYLLIGEHTKAVNAINQALANLEIPEIIYYLKAGEIYQKTGNEKSALNAYEMALGIDPTNQQAIDAISMLTKQ